MKGNGKKERAEITEKKHQMYEEIKKKVLNERIKERNKKTEIRGIIKRKQECCELGPTQHKDTDTVTQCVVNLRYFKLVSHEIKRHEGDLCERCLIVSGAIYTILKADNSFITNIQQGTVFTSASSISVPTVFFTICSEKLNHKAEVFIINVHSAAGS